MQIYGIKPILSLKKAVFKLNKIYVKSQIRMDMIFILAMLSIDLFSWAASWVVSWAISWVVLPKKIFQHRSPIIQI